MNAFIFQQLCLACAVHDSNWTSLFAREIVADVNAFNGNLDKIGLGLDSQYRFVDYTETHKMCSGHTNQKQQTIAGAMHPLHILSQLSTFFVTTYYVLLILVTCMGTNIPTNSTHVFLFCFNYARAHTHTHAHAHTHTHTRAHTQTHI